MTTAYSYDRRHAASDIQVHDVEFASGQEPDDQIAMGEKVMTLVRAEFTVSGRTLAKALGKQFRVLESFLTKAKARQLIHTLYGDREVLRIVGRKAKNMVQSYIVRDLGEDSPRLTVDFSEESDLPYTAKIDARNLSVRVEMEFDVWSR